MDPQQAYLAHRPFIDRSVATICVRHHVSWTDRDDFSSAAHLHMVRDDYAVFRTFEGRAPIEIYLLAVLRRLFQDWRNSQWGRWRPSAAARRHGPVAVLLETARVRDGLSMPEAIELLRTNHGVPDTPNELYALDAWLPVRTRRVAVSAGVLEGQETARPGSDVYLDVEEAGRVSAALDQALATLSSQDRLLLRLRFDDAVPIGSLARVLGADYQTAYRHLGRVLQHLRRAVETSGVSAIDAASVLARRGLVLREERHP